MRGVSTQGLGGSEVEGNDTEPIFGVVVYGWTGLESCFLRGWEGKCWLVIPCVDMYGCFLQEDRSRS